MENENVHHDEIKPDSPAETMTEEVISYSQEQFNNIIARENAKTLEKALKELGFDGTGKAKEQLSAFKAKLLEREAALAAATAEKDEQSKALSELNARLFGEKAKNALLSVGVLDGEIEAAMPLLKAFLGEDGDVFRAAELAVEKYPHLRRAKREIPTFSVPVSGQKDGFSQIREAFRKK